LAALKAHREGILEEIASQEAGIGGVEAELAAERSHLAQEREAIGAKQQALLNDKVSCMVSLGKWFFSSHLYRDSTCMST